jgi:hypothetical protein
MNQQPLLVSDSAQDDDRSINQISSTSELPREEQPSASWSTTLKHHFHMHFSLFKNHWYGFYVTTFGMSIGTAVFQTIIPIVLRQQGESDATIGWIVALNGVGRFIAEVPITKLSMAFGPWLTSLISMIVLILAFLVPTLWISHLWSWIVAMSVGGVAVAGFSTPRHELLQAGFRKAERSRVSSHMGMLARISFLVAPPSCGAIYLHIGPRYSLVFGIAFLLITLGALYADELIQLDEKLKQSHSEELAKKKREEDLKKQELLTGVAGSRHLFASESKDDVSDLDVANNAASEMDTESNASFTSNNNHNNNNLVTVNNNSGSGEENKKKSADEQHHASVSDALAEHWRTVLGVGSLTMSIMSLRQARRLTITLRALNLNFNAKDVGLILAGSFVVDAIFFWVSSTVVNKLFALSYSFMVVHSLWNRLNRQMDLHSLSSSVFLFSALVILLALEFCSV